MASVYGHVVAAVLFLAVPALSGCGLGRAAECNKLIGTLNGQQESMKKASGKYSSSQSPSDIENLATTFETSAGAIKAVELTDPKLKQHSKEYQDLLMRWGKNFRDLAAAMKKKDAAAHAKAQSANNALGKEETTIVNNINNYCQGR